MQVNIKFKNWQQREFFYSTARNQCFSGGFNNGKSWVLCLKALILLLTYSNYRVVIARQKYTDLRKTTMQSFFAMCPSEFIAGHNEQEGLTQLINGSLIYWMHLDHVDENSLRGLEPNSIFIDQGEEVSDAVLIALDSRVGRWAHAITPQTLLDQFPDWPYKNERPVTPSYMAIGCNPDTEFHYIYRKYHPDSIERNPDYFFIEGEWDPGLGSEESYENALKNDPEWIKKYVQGKWGSSDASIHRVLPIHVLKNVTKEQYREILSHGALYRSMDHGSSAPTACAWISAYRGVYIFYREYYVANQRISFHRKEIASLSQNEFYGEETYLQSFADPHIFDKASQAKGGIYSVADEYSDKALEGEPIFWQKADNNEFATRNRINELLVPSKSYKHPFTNESPAPGIYFLEKCAEYPNGCKEIIKQTGAQRKKLLGSIDGKNIYSEDRDEAMVDHAYDIVRYLVSMHSKSKTPMKQKPQRMTMEYYQAVMRKQLYARSSVPST